MSGKHFRQRRSRGDILHQSNSLVATQISLCTACFSCLSSQIAARKLPSQPYQNFAILLIFKVKIKKKIRVSVQISSSFPYTNCPILVTISKALPCHQPTFARKTSRHVLEPPRTLNLRSVANRYSVYYNGPFTLFSSFSPRQ